MLHVPILRHGKAYESVEKTPLVHHATGETIGEISIANSGLIVRDVQRMRDDLLERFSVAELLRCCRRAADLFTSAELPLGDPDGPRQSFDEYVACLSATTGMPVTYCRDNAAKIRRVLSEMDGVLAGLTRGLDLTVLDRGWGTQTASKPQPSGSGPVGAATGDAGATSRTVSFYRTGRIFGAVLPSNSPGVHSLWIPAIALKTPIVLKPGREEPWTPLRVIEALAAGGAPREAFGFYPTDHTGAAEILRVCDRSMLFGDERTTRPYRDDPRVDLHGPGFSKILLGDDVADNWPQHLDVLVQSIAGNAGRSCINASGVWTPRHAHEIADALAERLARMQALPVDDPRAQVAAFANPQIAERISATIDHALREPGAVDVTQQKRGSPRLVRRGGVAYLLPTVIRCDHPGHPLANREFLFPFASVVRCPTREVPARIGPTLVVSAITGSADLQRALMNCANVDRLNLGSIPTNVISRDQPHEGNLFEHLYRQRAFQSDSAA